MFSLQQNLNLLFYVNCDGHWSCSCSFFFFCYCSYSCFCSCSFSCSYPCSCSCSFHFSDNLLTIYWVASRPTYQNPPRQCNGLQEEEGAGRKGSLLQPVRGGRRSHHQRRQGTSWIPAVITFNSVCQWYLASVIAWWRSKLDQNCSSQLFQPLGEMWSCYHGKWFSSHRFGFGSSGKLKFGLNSHMT